MTHPFGDVHIIDFSRVVSGPLATMLLADLGASVTKVERPGTGDDTRSFPPYDERGQSTYFQAVNRNKDSVVLDLRSADGVRAASELIDGADVVVENFRTGVMARFGLDYATLAASHPGLVYCSITGFGSGPGARLAGYDLLVQALGGLMSITGEPAGKPQIVGAAFIDVITGLFATVGVLAALRHRDAIGEGQHVEVNLMSALLAALGNDASEYTLAGIVAQRTGSDHPSVAPYGLFAAEDADLVLAVGNDRQFRELADVLGEPEIADDPRFSTNADRVANLPMLRTELENILRTHPVAEWSDKLMKAGVPAGRVNNIAQAFRLAETLGLEPTVAVPRADGSVARLVRNPIRLSRTPVTYRSAPPALAADVLSPGKQVS